MESRPPRLGELLVESQIITRAQLEEILELQRRDGRRLGTLLVEAGVVTETQVTQILSQQLSVPWVSLYHIDFSRQLLNLVSQQIAEKYCLVPIFVRRVRGLGETLYVAMDDPSDERAQREVTQYSGLPVRAMIAPPSDIRSAIRVYYGTSTETPSLSEAVAELAAEQAARTRPAEPPPAPPSRVAAAPPAATSGAAGSDSAVFAPVSVPPVAEREPISEPPDSGPQIEAREISMPPPKRGSPRKMVTLTLLDGTQVNLPARSPRVPSEPVPKDASELTARDLIAALRAMSHGADASEIVGSDARWEPLFAALLSLLLKKHLIADWEFVEEFKKM
jgi:type IV pilus assembly protein PilB